MDVLGYGLARRTLAGVDNPIEKLVSLQASQRVSSCFIEKNSFRRLSLSFSMHPQFLSIKRKLFQGIGVFFFIFLAWPYPFGLPNAYSQPDQDTGIQPLLALEGKTIQELLPFPIQPLIFPQEIEEFLKKLDGKPPDWTKFRHSDMAEQSEQLFQFNRQRDTDRTVKGALLKQRVAFVWAGFLREYLPEFQGFSVALGPELTHTSWGIIRFKPVDLPDYLVAVPSIHLRKHLLTRQKQGEPIEIMIVCIGNVISQESLIYAYSHDGHQDGMILPVVSIQKLLYVLKPS
jgi:hypothetical protein